MYKRLLEEGKQAVANKLLTVIGEFVVKNFPSYPNVFIYFLISLEACALFAVLTILMYIAIRLSKRLEGIFKRSYYERWAEWLCALLFSYGIIYTVVIPTVMKAPRWADFAIMLINAFLVAVNCIINAFMSDVRERVLLNIRRIDPLQQLIGRVANFLFQGFITLFAAIFVYMFFLGYSSYPAEVKKYEEYAICLIADTFISSVYLYVIAREIYKLTKLEYEMVSRRAW